MLSQSLGHRIILPVPSFQSYRESLGQDPNGSDRICLSHSPSLASTSLVSLVLKMLMRAPVLLLMRLDLLKSPDQIPQSLLVEEWMFLAAWPISGRNSPYKALLTELPAYSSNPGGHTHTHSGYNSAWSSWCVTKEVNTLLVPLADILEFLTDNFNLGLQYRTLNTLRSAISITHSKADDCPVGTHPL